LCNDRVDFRGDLLERLILREGRPLLERYRYRPDAVFRYYGDEKETTARAELTDLLAWMEKGCPRIVRRIARLAAKPPAGGRRGARELGRVDRPDLAWVRSGSFNACSDGTVDDVADEFSDGRRSSDAILRGVAEEFPPRFRSAARAGCREALTRRRR
jgi:hypothetical protein